MRREWTLAALAVWPVVSALCCGGRSVRADGGTHPEADAGVDGPLADAEPPQCDGIVTWTLVPRSVESVALVDGIARFAVTERLLVAVQLHSPCEVLAGIEVTVSPGGATDFVSLAASAWEPEGVDCLPTAPLVERVLSLPGRQHGNLRVVVRDERAPGGEQLLSYERDPCSGVPDCQCYPGVPPGDGGEWADCVTDCSCAVGLGCVGYYGIAGPLWNCVRVCSDFLDCAPGETCLENVADAAPHVCVSYGDACQTDDECPRGFTCAEGTAGKYCADGRVGPTGQACACDVECPAGHLCVRTGAEATCEVPCLSSAGCPDAPGDPLVCTNRFLCAYGD